MNPERQPKPEIAPELVRGYTATFIPRFDLYPIQRSDTGRYVSVKKPLNLTLVEAHLQGDLTLGAYALNGQSLAKWICLDADDKPQWDNLWRMAHRLHRQGVTSYLEPSRRGGHLWLFLSPIPGEQARRFGLQLQAEHDLLDVELFPKQDELKTGPGSLVRLPLGIHRKDGRRYYFLKLNGQPLADTIRAQIELLASPTLVPEGFVRQLLAQAPETSPRVATPQFIPWDDDHHLPEIDLPLSERLKSRISVYEFASRFVELDERGRGKCPFHDDTHASFSIDRQRNYWHCFAGCGGGSLIDFWAKWRETQGQPGDFTETIKELAAMLLATSNTG